MINDFKDFCTWMYVVTDEIWLKIAPFIERPGPRPECPDSELLPMTLTGECRGWDVETEMLGQWQRYRDLFPVIPTQSRFNRRRRGLMHAFNSIRRVVLQWLDVAQDRPELLKRALVSLSNQTFERFEVVVVNDGGRDISETLKPFKKYFLLIYMHNPISQGRSAALNIGVKNSTGSWVFFLDDDDIVYPWHFDALITGTKINTEAQIFYGNKNLLGNHQFSNRDVIHDCGIW